VLVGWHARMYLVCMKRTNLVLDAQLLEEATRLSGEKTFSRTVERALEEFVRRIKARQILSLQGSGLWEGDLGEMRRDAKNSPRRRSRAV
jgi:Arc/MetJ family transcription regulator